MIPTPTPFTFSRTLPQTSEELPPTEDMIRRRRTAGEIRQMLRDIAWVLHWTQRIKHELAAEQTIFPPEDDPTNGEALVAELPA
jgi:hypothetical protein